MNTFIVPLRNLVMASALLLALSLLPFSCASIGPSTDLRIVNRVVSPDGFNRSSVLAGGTFPGPVIRGFKGNRFRINVVDALTDDTMVKSTSIHWHGIFQTTTSWADGTSFVTQCPITPGDSFLYDFTIQDQAGTFWYHSHLSTQYCDGLRGAFIVYDPFDPHRLLYDVDNESTILTLADWYHTPAPAAAGQLPPHSAATLINGKGRYTGGPAVPLTVINVVHGLRYRFRVIAMVCDPDMTFSIDGHKFTVIEADGVNTQPLQVDSIQIFAGQRYSLVMRADQPIGNYWIRAEPNADRATPGFAGGINSAILRYVGAQNVEPTTTQSPSTLPFKETNLHPLVSPAAPGAPHQGGADVVLNIPHYFDFNTFQYRMNGYPWVPPTMPVLLQILSGAQSAQDLLPNGSVYTLPPNKVIEISLPGTGADQGGPHPFHLHGHTFSVVRSADSTAYNFVDPVRRDTVNTGLYDSNVTIRFITDNSGPWFLHCHIDWHLELGLAVVFAEDPGSSAHDDPPASWDNLCPKYNQFINSSG